MESGAVSAESERAHGRRPSRAATSPSCAAALDQNSVDLGGTDEIVLVQPADGMRLETDARITPAALDVRMVVLDVRHVRHRVHEAHGAIEVRKLELAPDGLAVLDQLPARLPASGRQQAA